MGLMVTLGALIGVVMGLTGAGGGILAVPALVAGMGLSMQQATPVALVAVALAATVGTVEGLRRGVVRWRAAFWMAAWGAPMTWAGLWMAQRLPNRALLLLFAAVVAYSAWRGWAQWLAARRAAALGAPAAQDDASEAWWPSVGTLSPETGRFVWTPPTFATLAALGATVGFATGLLGVGGGFLMVPLLRRLTHLGWANVAGTSLMVQALVSSGGLLSAGSQGAVWPMPLTAAFAGAMVLGMALGRWANRHVSAQASRAALAALLSGVALVLLWQAVR